MNTFSLRGRIVTAIGTLALALPICGCEDKIGKCYEVSGQVLLDGQPIRGKAGTVFFKPDGAKGNVDGIAAIGNVDANGVYQLSTLGKPGALAGWYKVIVNIFPPGADEHDGVRERTINPRYNTEASTPLSVEVVPDASPGAYDLKTTRK